MFKKKWIMLFIMSTTLLINNTLFCNATKEPTSWQEKKLEELYSWFNTISDPKAPFSKEELNHFFTADFVMQANNQEITHNYQDLYDHFVEFRESGKILTVNFPLDEIVIGQDGQKAAVRYSITEKLQDGGKIELLVIAIWHFASDGRLQRMNEVVVQK